MQAAATLTQPLHGRVNQTQVTLLRDDLTALAVDAVVFYAKETLELGSGFGTAIQTRGGEAVKKELEKIGSVRMGEAVITGAGRLKARHVIHACGPKFQEADTEQKLHGCMLAALRLAGEGGLESIAFPPIGTGFYGVPLELCSRVMLDTIRDYLRGETSLREVFICVMDRREFDAFKGKVEGL
jgi:O-acetyl-ADP-ribose deacetylase (regulator of RNase III)